MKEVKLDSKEMAKFERWQKEQDYRKKYNALRRTKLEMCFRICEQAGTVPTEAEIEAEARRRGLIS